MWPTRRGPEHRAGVRSTVPVWPARSPVCPGQLLFRRVLSSGDPTLMDCERHVCQMPKPTPCNQGHQGAGSPHVGGGGGIDPEPQRSGCPSLPAPPPEGHGRPRTLQPKDPPPQFQKVLPVLSWSSSSLLCHSCCHLVFSSHFPSLCIWVISLRAISVLESSAPFL